MTLVRDIINKQNDSFYKQNEKIDKPTLPISYIYDYNYIRYHKYLTNRTTTKNSMGSGHGHWYGLKY